MHLFTDSEMDLRHLEEIIFSGIRDRLNWWLINAFTINKMLGLTTGASQYKKYISIDRHSSSSSQGIVL